MEAVFQLIDAAKPLIGFEGVITAKVVVWFLTSYYLLVGVPVALSIWIAYKLTWK